MKSFADVAIVKGSSHELEALGSRFHEVLARYAEEEQQQDFIWRYSERPLVGALAAAVWLAGGVALEEYGGRKQKEDTGEGHGRTDLYFKLGDQKYICEAKHKYIALDEIKDNWSTGLVVECLKDAQNNTLNGDEIAVGIAFWSVFVDLKKTKKVDGLRKQILAVGDMVKNYGGYVSQLTTCYFPAWAFDTKIDHGEGERHYLGVIMKLVPIKRIQSKHNKQTIPLYRPASEMTWKERTAPRDQICLTLLLKNEAFSKRKPKQK